MGIKHDGTITAIHAQIIADMGGYHTLLTPFIPAFSAFVMSGCYKIPAVQTDIVGRVHEQVPHRRDPRRRTARGHPPDRDDDRPGAPPRSGWTRSSSGGRTSSPRRTSRPRSPSASSTTPATTRARWTSSSPTSTSTPSAREQEELRAQGIYRGVGFSTYMEICGLAPSRAVGPEGVGLQAGFWESAVVRVHPSGSATVFTGHLPARPGPRDRLRPDRGRPHRHPAPIRSRSSTATPTRARTAWAPTARARWPSAARRAPRGATRSPTRQEDRRPPARGRARGHRAGRRQIPGSRLAGQGHDVAEVSGAAYIPEDLPEGMEPGLEETTSTTRRTSSGPSARTPASSTWTPRPARSRSCATCAWTTAARRSTRCSSTARSMAASPTPSARRSTSRSPTTRRASS